MEKVIKTVIICIIGTVWACNPQMSDPTRPDIAKKAKQIRNTHTERFSGE
jgi:hypothetical protein